MELVEALTTALGTDPGKAQAVAGGLLGAVQDAVAQKAGPDAAAKLGEAVPELAGWKGAAAALLGGGAAGGGAAQGALGGLLGGALGGGGSAGAGGLLGALGGAAASALGGAGGGSGGGGADNPLGALSGALAGNGPPTQALMALSQLLQKLDLDPAKAMAIGSVLFGFLQSRLSPETLALITRALPALSGLGGAAGGGLFGALGGLMGGGGGGGLGGLGGLMGGGGSAPH